VFESLNALSVKRLCQILVDQYHLKHCTCQVAMTILLGPMDFTAPLGRGSRPRASTRYAHSDPRAATAALGDGKIHGPSLRGGIMYHFTKNYKMLPNLT
jgi:hypothetical protein